MAENVTPLSRNDLVPWVKVDRTAEAAASREWALPDALELYRSIYTQLQIESLKTLAVCSSIPREGKTTTSLGIATAYAQDFPGKRVILIECDVTRPILADDFGLTGMPGFVDYLGGYVQGHPCHRSLLQNFHLLPVGGNTDNASQLFRSGALQHALEILARDHDLLILDVGSIVASSDARVICSSADGAILVARTGMTPVNLVNQSVELIGSRFRGVVLNAEATSVPSILRRLIGG